MFLMFDFQFSYFFGLNLIPWIFSLFGLVDLWYPYRAAIGAFGMFLMICCGHVIGSIVATIKYRDRPDKYLRRVIKAYFFRIQQSKFKKK